MGTSNWQNISLCVDALMKIEPRRVLDVGIGFGRWGVIIREFCEVWYDRVTPSDWVIEVEGIEAFEPNIADYHRHFYNRIHVGDAREVIPTLSGRFDVVLFGDVLEHFERAEGERLLNWALDTSTYVIVNIPLGEEWPQDDKYENPYERHLSEWDAADFARFALRREAYFRDFRDRPFGTFILSRDDPKGLTTSLFSAGTTLDAGAVEQGEEPAYGFDAADVGLLERVRAMRVEVLQLREEVRRIKASRSYRATQRVLHSRIGPVLWRAARKILPDHGGILRVLVNRDAAALLGPIRRRLGRVGGPPRGHVRVRPLGPHPDGKGAEIWFLSIERPDGASPDLEEARLSEGWERRPNPATPSGACLVTLGQGFVDVPAAPGSRLVFMTHPWSGLAEVAWNGGRATVDLHSIETGTVVVALGVEEPQIVHWRAPALTVNGKGRAGLAVVPSGPRGDAARLSAEERGWVERMVRDKPSAIAVMHPEWLGVRRSTVELFPHHLFLDDFIDEERGARSARLLLETGCDRIVIGGFPHSYIHLVRALHRLAPGVKLYDLWYGSFLQHGEDYAWTGFRMVEQLCRAGLVHKWGFVKKGMAEIMASTGLRTDFVMSLVRRVPSGPSVPAAGGPHFGIWAAQPTWRKLPYAMIAALRMVPGARMHGSSIEPRAAEFCRMIDVPADVSTTAIPLERMPEMLARMHVNLYVTLSECAPMVPLESLSVGAPCLLGPNSHFFEDHDYLHRRLVVPYPDRALKIAEFVRAALEERSAIVDAYRAYAPAYNGRALACLEDFLDAPAPAPAAAEYA